MSFSFSATTWVAASPEQVFQVVSNLDEYVSLLSIVHQVHAVAPGEWIVDLRADLGPISRSKRLRMIRAVSESPNQIRFERSENDGRKHACWVLGIQLRALSDGTELTADLNYDGRVPLGMLERVVASESDAAVRRLNARLNGEVAH